MSKLQQGTGYGFSRSGGSTTINVDPQPLQDYAIPDGNLVSAQIEVSLVYPFKIVKGAVPTTGSIADLLTALAVSFTDIVVSFVPDTGNSFSVLTGMVNGTVVAGGGPYDCSSSTNQNVYVQTYPDADIGLHITSGTLSDSDTAAYVLIGTVNADGKVQLVRNSIARERFKCGAEDAKYWYSYL